MNLIEKWKNKKRKSKKNRKRKRVNLKIKNNNSILSNMMVVRKDHGHQRKSKTEGGKTTIKDMRTTKPIKIAEFITIQNNIVMKKVLSGLSHNKNIRRSHLDH